VREKGKSCAKDDRLRESAVSKSVIVFIQKATTVTSLSAGASVETCHRRSCKKEYEQSRARDSRRQKETDRERERERESEREGER